MGEQMKTNMNVFGFEVNVDYMVEDGVVTINHVSAIGVPPIALEGYDLMSHVREDLQAQEDEAEDLEFYEGDVDPVKPF